MEVKAVIHGRDLKISPVKNEIMEVILLPDKRKAIIIGSISGKVVKVRLEDGREVPWPIERIQQTPKEGEETLKVVKIPAIDKLEEVQRYLKALGEIRGEWVPTALSMLEKELKVEVISEAKEKWNL